MKESTLLFSLLFAFTVQTKAQSAVTDSLTAHLTQISATTLNKVYSFVSLRKIENEKEDRIADRLIRTFPDLYAIQIQNQQVTVSLNSNAKEETLNEILKLFGYTNYKINQK